MKRVWIPFLAGIFFASAVIYFEANYEREAQAQAAKTLNAVQKAFVAEAARPMIEELLRIKARLDAFNADFDNMETAIASTTDALADGADDQPRTDAPKITGQQLATMRTVCGNMSGQLSGATYNAMVRLAVRDLDTILRER